MPVLKGNAEVIKAIREKLYEPAFSDLTVMDFSDLMQGCKTYDEFIEKMKDVSERSLKYYGVAVCGAKKKVNKLTGSISCWKRKGMRKSLPDLQGRKKKCYIPHHWCEIWRNHG